MQLINYLWMDLITQLEALIDTFVAFVLKSINFNIFKYSHFLQFNDNVAMCLCGSATLRGV